MSILCLLATAYALGTYISLITFPPPDRPASARKARGYRNAVARRLALRTAVSL